MQPGDFTYWKGHLQKDSLRPHWKGPYQVLLTNPCAAKLQGMDSWIHVTSKESTKPWVDLHTNWQLESKDFQELKQTASDETAFPRWTRPIYPFLTIASYLIFSLSTLDRHCFYAHFLIYCKGGKPLWLLDLSPETLICPWQQWPLLTL